MGRKEVKQGAPGGGVAALIHGLMWDPLSLVELDHQIRFRSGFKERLLTRSVRNLAFQICADLAFCIR